MVGNNSGTGQMGIERRPHRSRSASLTFGSTQVREIPRYDDESKPALFYDEAELNLMRCEANMKHAGMNPASFDWKSFR
jgi:hypothetical protein